VRAPSARYPCAPHTGSFPHKNTTRRELILLVAWLNITKMREVQLAGDPKEEARGKTRQGEEKGR